MLYVVKEVSVNTGRAQGDPVLTRSQVWDGLKWKANNALAFVAAMSKCEVIERTENGLVRDIEVRGQPARERITFYPEKKVAFLRLSGLADGFIVNEILDGTEGGPETTFQLCLATGGCRFGIAPGAGFRRGHGARIRCRRGHHAVRDSPGSPGRRDVGPA